MTRVWVCAAAAVLTVGVLSGCASAEDPGVPQSQQAGEPQPKQQGSSGGSNQSDGTFRFGQTRHGEIDMTIRKREPFTFTPGQWASPPSDHAWAVEITFHNNTQRVFSTGMIQVGATVDNQAVQEIFDAQNGYNGLIASPPVAPGQTVTVPVAYTGKGQVHTITLAPIMGGSESVVFTDKQ